MNEYVLLIDVIHKFLKDKYSKRFPELESLVHTPMEYIRTVKVTTTEKLHAVHVCICTCIVPCSYYKMILKLLKLI